MTTSFDTLTCKQVAEILHTTEAGLAQMRFRGTGPKFVKTGHRKVFYTRQSVEDFLAANTCQRTDDPRGAA
nr:DNA-binding protein [Mycolicibacterium austroafricanum]